MNVNLCGYRIVDLSLLLVPGQEERRLELRRGVIETDDSFYNEIDTMSHIGTHVETPLHFYGEGMGVADLPVETFVGEALLIDLGALPDGADVLAEDLRAAGADELKPGDVAVLTSGRAAEAAVHLTAEASAFLADKGIKMLAFDDSLGLGRDKETSRAVHDHLMKDGVPFLERLANLQAVTQARFVLMGLPWRVAGLDSSPVRAVALLKAEG